MKKIYVVLFLLISILCFSGCNPTEEATFDRFTVNGSKVSKQNGKYEITSNFNKIKSYVSITDNVGSYKLVQTEYLGGDRLKDNDVDYVCYSPSGNNPYELLKDVSYGNDYKLTYTFYSGKDCTGSNLGDLIQWFYTYSETSSNEKYISVENIKSKLGSWSYTNKKNGVEVSCASYGIEDKEENIPLCIGLARAGATATDCGQFIKDIIRKGSGKTVSTIFSYGKKIGETYYSASTSTPSELKDGDLITFYREGGSGHIGMVFYWDAKGGWYVVSGNMSQKVKIHTLSESLKYSVYDQKLKRAVWDYYEYRSI